MIDMYDEASGITLKNVPDNWTFNTPEAIAFYMSVKDNGSGSYDYSAGTPQPSTTEALERGIPQETQVVQPQSLTTPQAEAPLTAMDKIRGFIGMDRRDPNKSTLENTMGSLQQGATETAEAMEGKIGATIRGGAPTAIAYALGGAPAATVLTLAKTVGDPLTGIVNNMFGTNMQTPSESIQYLMTLARVPEAKTAIDRVIQSGLEATGDTLGWVNLGKFLNPGKLLAPTTTAERVGATLEASPAQQVATDVSAVTAGKIAEELDAPPLVQAGVSLLGGLGGSKAVKGDVPAVDVGLNKYLKEAAEKANISLKTTDVIPPKTFIGKWAQTIGESIPFTGTGKGRASQQVERIDAVTDLLTEYGIDDLSKATDKMTDVTEALLERQKRLLGNYTKSKLEVLDKLDSADVVPTSNSIKIIDEKIAYLKGLKNNKLTPLISELENTKESLSDQTLRNVETNRKLLGDFFNSKEVLDNKAISNQKQFIINDVYGAVNEDIGSYIKNVGGEADFNKWKVTNKKIHDTLSNVKTKGLKKLMEDPNANPEDISSLMFGTKKSTMKDIYNNLNPVGKQKVRGAMLARVAKKSQFADQDTVSPDKFLNALKKMSDETGVYFKGEEEDQLKGLIKVLNATKRAGQASATPPTGKLLVPTAISGVALDIAEKMGIGGGGTQLITAAAITELIGVGASVYETKAVRNLLIKLADTTPGSKNEAGVMRMLSDAINKSAQESKTLHNVGEFVDKKILGVNKYNLEKKDNEYQLEK